MIQPVQPELDFTAAALPASAVATVADVEQLVGILKVHGQQNAAQICGKLGLPVTENNKRKIRAIARAARPGIVSFPNSNGYKLAADCTVEELWQWINAIDSQVKDLTATKKLALDYYYSRGGK